MSTSSSKTSTMESPVGSWHEVLGSGDTGSKHICFTQLSLWFVSTWQSGLAVLSPGLLLLLVLASCTASWKVNTSSRFAFWACAIAYHGTFLCGGWNQLIATDFLHFALGWSAPNCVSTIRQHVPWSKNPLLFFILVFLGSSKQLVTADDYEIVNKYSIITHWITHCASETTPFNS